MYSRSDLLWTSKKDRGSKLLSIVVEPGRCEGHAMCVAESPAVFDLDEEGHVQVLDERPPDDLRSSVKRAVLACPMRALSLRDHP
jgi:ferredoxin